MVGSYILPYMEKSRNAEDGSSTHLLPLDLLSVEDLDGHFVSRQLVLCTLHLAKTTMAQCLSKNVPGDRRRGGREEGRKGGREEGRKGGREGGRRRREGRRGGH